ncbi:DEAD/DEAH box helicase [Cavenderia fasciculata]|uniref:DEAD/DEAH box helicase n=1 Tax=Cavenderia fasciculata TaxID=261658 RepID=F4QDX4_CACFS|nr:DEAD/DEAH box helicase [Cavenderia fasciculata]EGG13921.1 DEAD/DEAH box helicase [Cavenderia fasciculata]|eukprot:XP_004350629.1 DEAD/DEAH box helicase [Cavenderia fasciculata]
MTTTVQDIQDFLRELEGLEKESTGELAASTPSHLVYNNDKSLKTNITASGPNSIPDLRVFDNNDFSLFNFPISSNVTIPKQNNQQDIKKELSQQYINVELIKDNKFYQNNSWPRTIDCTGMAWKDLLGIQVSEPSSTIELRVDNVNHRLSMTEYHEVPLNQQITSTNSTSLMRAWNKHNGTDFHRGDASSFPFLPGGLDDIQKKTNNNNIEKEEIDIDWLSFWKDPSSLLNKPPGMIEGLIIIEEKEKEKEKIEENLFYNQEMEEEEEEMEEEEIEQEEEEEEMEEMEEMKEMKKEENISSTLNTLSPSSISIDSIISIDSSTSSSLLKFKKKEEEDPLSNQKMWAFHETKEIFTPFAELITNPAIVYPFELDSFQKQAIVHMEKGESVFISAHTSAGKTVIAEYAIAMAAKNMTRAIYTSPIKALSNQKFRDFKNTFGDVGLITGDVSVSPASSCLVLTTEILRSMLYKGADLIRDIEWVIFDEVHYLNDYERGVVWEEVIIMLPAHVKIILLSATVANPLEFADWIGRTKKMPIYVIGTLKRPVPLEHFIHTPSNDLFKIVDSNRNFLMEGYSNAYNSLYKVDKNNDKNKKTTGQHGNQASFASVSKTGWTRLIGLLKEKQQLPVIVFSFSKNKCQEYAQSLGGHLVLTSNSEKNIIKIFIEESLARLRPEDKDLPQIHQIKDFLERGIGIHHGGLLPIVKELVEILFSKSLVKVLFATETFAMGVNMPAKTVVYSHTRKHDGINFRDLLPGEYTQMSGRAGRRGLDKVGTVIITAWKDMPDSSSYSSMILGQPSKLNSQFRLTYNMILNLLRVQDFKVEDMIKRSFSEFSTQKDIPELQKAIESLSIEYQAIEPIQCILGEPDIENYYNMFSEAQVLNENVQRTILSSNNQQYFGDGRVIVLSIGDDMTFKNYTIGVILSCNNTIQKQYLNSTIERTFNIFSLELDQEHGLRGYKIYSSNGHEIQRICTEKIVNINTKAIKDGDQDSIGILQQQLLRLLEKYPLPLGPPSIDPISKLKLRSIEFVDQFDKLQNIQKLIPTSKCNNCPKLSNHYTITKHKHDIKTKMNEYKHTSSDENLQLMPEFQIRLKILETLGYIDGENNVMVKGKVSREVNTCEELIIPELIFENAFLMLEPSEIVSVLSCLIFQEKDAIEPSLTPRLIQARDNLIKINEKLCQLEIDHGLQVTLEEKEKILKFGLMEVTYEWARGMPFNDICKLTNVLEGTIVRAITRIGETCQEVRNCARIIGDTKLYQKMDEAIRLIKRDIVFASSLYVV